MLLKQQYIYLLKDTVGQAHPWNFSFYPIKPVTSSSSPICSSFPPPTPDTSCHQHIPSILVCAFPSPSLCRSVFRVQTQVLSPEWPLLWVTSPSFSTSLSMSCSGLQASRSFVVVLVVLMFLFVYWEFHTMYFNVFLPKIFPGPPLNSLNLIFFIF